MFADRSPDSASSIPEASVESEDASHDLARSSCDGTASRQDASSDDERCLLPLTVGGGEGPTIRAFPHHGHGQIPYRSAVDVDTEVHRLPLVAGARVHGSGDRRISRRGAIPEFGGSRGVLVVSIQEPQRCGDPDQRGDHAHDHAQTRQGQVPAEPAHATRPARLPCTTAWSSHVGLRGPSVEPKRTGASCGRHDIRCGSSIRSHTLVRCRA